jgi:SAM-dependent methyltransferase
VKSDIKEALSNFIDFYTVKNKIYGRGEDLYHFGYFVSQNDVIDRLIYTVTKITSLLEKYPYLFKDKSLLDYGCGTGEHSFILSHFCSSIDCFDPEPSHNYLLHNLFDSSNQINVISEKDCFETHYDTVFVSGVLECVPDYVNWFNTLCSKLHCKNIILIFAPDEERLVDGYSKTYRYLDDSKYQTTTNEKELLQSIEGLNLIDRFSFITQGHQHSNHKKVIHIYEKN